MPFLQTIPIKCKFGVTSVEEMELRPYTPSALSVIIIAISSLPKKGLSL
jgi:hypothetical protein